MERDQNLPALFSPFVPFVLFVVNILRVRPRDVLDAAAD